MGCADPILPPPPSSITAAALQAPSGGHPTQGAQGGSGAGGAAGAMHMVRRADQVDIVCNGSQQSWHLVCRGTHWVGQFGNCTDSQSSQFNCFFFTRPRDIAYLPVFYTMYLEQQLLSFLLLSV